MDPGPTLRVARERAGLSQRALARRAHVPQSTVARIERGRTDPGVGMFARLLRACGQELMTANATEGIDRTLIRAHLDLTPIERIERVVAAARFAEQLQAARSQAPP